MSHHRDMHIINLLLITSAYSFEKLVVVQRLERENESHTMLFCRPQKNVNAVIPNDQDISMNEKSSEQHSFILVCESKQL